MSFLRLNNGTLPSAPAAGKCQMGSDNAGVFSTTDQFGVVARLGDYHLYNYLRNSGLWFAQRQAPATLTTYSSIGGRALTADGWGVSNENASVQYVRTDTGVSPETNLINRYYGSWSKITALGKIVLAQVVEAVDSESLRTRTVRFQCKLKAFGGNATWRIGLAQSTLGSIDTVPSGAGLFVTAFNGNTTDPTLGTNLAFLTPKASVTYSNSTVVGNAASCTVTGNWSSFGCVFDVPSGTRNLVVMIWSDSQVPVTSSISVTEASLTEGLEIQNWAPKPVGLELARCQRYYTKSFDVDVAPVQNAGLAGSIRGSVSVAGAVAAQPIGVRFPVQMRAAPATLVFFNPSAANAFVRNTTAGTDATATASANAAASGMDVTFTGIAAWTVAQAVAAHFTADAEL